MLLWCWEPDSSPARAESTQQLTASPAPTLKLLVITFRSCFCGLPGPLFLCLPFLLVCLAFLVRGTFSVCAVCSGPISGTIERGFHWRVIWVACLGILEVIFSVLCDLVSRNQSGSWFLVLGIRQPSITHLPLSCTETPFPVSYLVKCRPRCHCSEEKKSLFSTFLPVLP